MHTLGNLPPPSRFPIPSKALCSGGRLSGGSCLPCINSATVLMPVSSITVGLDTRCYVRILFLAFTVLPSLPALAPEGLLAGASTRGLA
jgi:hypothetical protein